MHSSARERGDAGRVIPVGCMRKQACYEFDKSLLCEMRIYGGQQGIWIDKATTAGASLDSNGITVSILYTGKHYADDLSDEGVLYHYPVTQRRGKDLSEIDATKAVLKPLKNRPHIEALRWRYDTKS